MPFVITEPCIGVKDATCVEVCPVDCISSSDDDQMFYIDPVTCIDCAYCESVCPVNAIFDEFAVPAAWRGYIRKNREYFNGKKK
jgi:NAD-dependent dihydropyrimidine dehydrogenase PreA subunit